MLEVYRPPQHLLLDAAARSGADQPGSSQAPTLPVGRNRSALLLAASVVLFGLTVAATTLVEWKLAARIVGGIAYGSAALLALAGAVVGVAALVVTKRRPRTVLGIVGVVAAVAANLAMTLTGAVIALLWTVGFARGRQLRRFGRILLPTVGNGSSWARLPVELGPLTLPDALACQWRENGKTEHASVAAFARLTLDLMALGAPPRLISGANRDALDEIRHAELCFSLARSIDGKSESPSPFPQAQHAGGLPRARMLALAKLAVDSLIDGALHEGVSARVIAKLVKRCEVPAIRALLKEIAADEGRHAAHGWDVVAWCFAEAPAAVAPALLGAIRLLPGEMRSTLPDEAAQGAWERWGIPGRTLEHEEYRATRAHVIASVRDLTTLHSRAA